MLIDNRRLTQLRFGKPDGVDMHHRFYRTFFSALSNIHLFDSMLCSALNNNFSLVDIDLGALHDHADFVAARNQV